MQKLLIVVCMFFLLTKLTACKKPVKITDTNNLQNYYPYDAYTDTVLKYFDLNLSVCQYYVNVHSQKDTFNNNFELISSGNANNNIILDVVPIIDVGNRQLEEQSFSLKPITLTDSNTAKNRLIFSRGNYPPDLTEQTNLAEYINNYFIGDFEYLNIYWSKDTLKCKYLYLMTDTYSVNNLKIITKFSKGFDNIHFYAFVPEK